MALTVAQQNAVTARGNVLVMAGAGTGKTKALVERCLDCLLHEQPPASLDEILVVTFTEAAAAEMRQRIRSRLLEESLTAPENRHWQEQLGLFETAHIGTLHSFCLKLIRQHFYELELDPQLTVLPEEETRLIAEETLEELLVKYYEGNDSAGEAVRQLIQSYGKGSDQPVRQLILRLHDYTQTLPSPGAWFESQLQAFSKSTPDLWRTWFLTAARDWTDHARQVFTQLTPTSELAANCLSALVDSPGDTGRAFENSDEFISRLLQRVMEKAQCRTREPKSARPQSLQALLEELAFLHSLIGTSSAPEPLQQDWEWSRSAMATLVRLAREFTTAFAEQKRELGSVDFHDLEQHALRLLWDTDGQPSAIARQWQHKLRFVFVDEYQDINTAQDRILAALSRDGTQSNRFLVGDVKQSIYRFRLANPRIFQNYAAAWRSGNNCTIPLLENFRSRQGIIDFVNGVFAQTMRGDLGGVEYDQEAQLLFGAAAERQDQATTSGNSHCLELNLRIKGKQRAVEAGAERPDPLLEIGDLAESAKEARLVGLRLAQLKAEGHPVWDEQLAKFRPVEWRDMAVLLRAPSNKSESFAKEFTRLGVPLQVEHGGFYSSSEISDLLSLLQILDNPLQDVPAIAVLHSPLVGLSLDELAAIRLASLKAPFWTALNRWQLQSSESAAGPASKGPAVDGGAELRHKLSLFLERYGRWRRLARQGSLSRCLEAVLTETHYFTWLRLQPRGERRRANVQRLLVVAQDFDRLQRQGLYRFLRFIDAQQRAETEPEVSAVSGQDAVRLLSIHQSKGLEFPVVAVADLAKAFNVVDLRADLILDEEYGLCPQIIPPGIRKRYPSIAHWLAARRQKRELLGEELRLLYVAMTRARDLLILACSLSEKEYATVWSADGEPPAPDMASSCADWLALALRKVAPAAIQFGRNDEVLLNGPTGSYRLRCSLHEDSSLLGPELPPGDPGGKASDHEIGLPAEATEQLRQNLSWHYGYASATREAAKTTVSALRRRAAVFDAATAKLSPLAHGALPNRDPLSFSTPSRTPSTAAEMGTAHHLFLQYVDLEKTASIALLEGEMSRLQKISILTPLQASLLDIKAIGRFWASELGSRIRAQAAFLHRELPFTFRLSPAELAEFTGQPTLAGSGQSVQRAADSEFIVVQGVADLAVVLPTEIWLLDFKTDRVKPENDLPVQTYAPQLKLYARALNLIYARPVTQCWLWFLSASEGRQVAL